MAIEKNKERAAFEAWFESRFESTKLHKFDDGVYWHERAQMSWEAWQASKAQAVPEGFVLVEREKLAMIFETATNALVYHAAPPKHDALSIIQGIARRAMIDAQEQK